MNNDMRMAGARNWKMETKKSWIPKNPGRGEGPPQGCSTTKNGGDERDHYFTHIQCVAHKEHCTSITKAGEFCVRK